MGTMNAAHLLDEALGEVARVQPRVVPLAQRLYGQVQPLGLHCARLENKACDPEY